MISYTIAWSIYSFHLEEGMFIRQGKDGSPHEDFAKLALQAKTAKIMGSWTVGQKYVLNFFIRLSETLLGLILSSILF